MQISKSCNLKQKKFPKSQAAYQPGRGTTEHVFALKILIEKAIVSSDYEINILLLDMSKAFDTIERDTLINDLSLVLNRDELHMFYILLKDVEIEVKVESETGKSFITNIGSPQGDSASAFLFIYYLALSLKSELPPDTFTNIPSNEHDYSRQTSQKDYRHDQQYADDTGWVQSTCLSNESPPISSKLCCPSCHSF